MAINKAVDRSAKSKSAMRNSIEYILNKNKIPDGLTYVSGPYRYDVIDYHHVMKSFWEEKKEWGKENGRLYTHNIISFSKDEPITPMQAYDFGVQFAEEWFQGFSTLVAVHQDKEHIHIHMISNTVSYLDGHKYQCSCGDLRDMKDYTNQMCLDRGLSVAVKGQHFDGTTIEKGDIISWNKNEYQHLISQSKDSYLADCGMAVMTSAEHCLTKDEFISNMNSQGWSVNWDDSKKHILFVDGEGHKIRDTRIEKNFHIPASKEGLLYEFKRQAEELAEKQRIGNEQYHHLHRGI